MPATTHPKPLDVVRLSAILQESLVELTDLAGRFPQLRPLQRRMSQVLDSTLDAIGPPKRLTEPAARQTHRATFVEQQGHMPGPTQREIDDLIETVAEFCVLAKERMQLMFATGDSSSATSLLEHFSRIRQAVERWILSPESGFENGEDVRQEFQTLADGLESIFLDPLQPGSVDQAQAALDDLTTMIRRFSTSRADSDSPTEGELFGSGSGLAESLFASWAANPPTDEALRIFSRRYQ